jgi:hypothetical protein
MFPLQKIPLHNGSMSKNFYMNPYIVLIIFNHVQLSPVAVDF